MQLVGLVGDMFSITRETKKLLDGGDIRRNSSKSRALGFKLSL